MVVANCLYYYYFGRASAHTCVLQDITSPQVSKGIKFACYSCQTSSVAPQCPYPDAYIGNTINAVSFDAVFVQFCEYCRLYLKEFARLLLTRHVDNNYCGLNNYANPNVRDFRSPYMRYSCLPRARTGTSLHGINRLTSFSILRTSFVQQG